MSQELINNQKIHVLKDRAQIFSRARQFFAHRNIIEVDCPIVSKAASVDAHIDLVEALACGTRSFLHTSPEYAMKRLLAMGMEDIYQFGHVFRDSEIGYKHNPEFMMAEWYRIDISFEEMIAETVAFIQLFLEDQLSTNDYETVSYRELFQKYLGFDYITISFDDLCDYFKKHEIEVSSELLDEGKDGLLNQLLALFIEPHLGTAQLTVLRDYPASQAALAKTFDKDGEQVAERFEVYFHGLELANGYHELVDAQEQRQRLIDSNKHRLRLGKKTLPIDENFLSALEQGIPDCCGVAVGVDRLMMLRHQASEIKDVIPFGWQEI